MKNRKKLLLTLNTSIISTTSIYLINKILYLKALSNERLFLDNSDFYNWKFGKIYYTCYGKGTPILLIHDLSSESSSYEWRKIISSLSKQHTVYTIDLVGCGQSDKPNITYTNYLYVQLVNDFIKNVIKNKTHIIATGMSSSIAVMACYIEPQLIQKLTLVNPPSQKKLAKYPKKYNNILKKIIQIPIWGTFIYNMYHSKLLISYRFKRKYLFNKELINSHTVEAFSEAAHLGGYTSKFLMSSIKSNYVNINISHALKSINNDIQVIFGSDYENRKVIQNYYRNCNSSIEFATISKTKYFPQIEQAEVFLSAIHF